MRKISFNHDWVVTDSSAKTVNSLLSNTTQSGKRVTLPYDCMIHESRRRDTRHGSQTGFYPGGSYSYTKRFSVPEEWEQGTALVEFEGVYGTAKVFVNNVLAHVSFEGYTPFTIGLNDYLIYGAENVIRVDVQNDEERNTRWYSGSGIYRSVYLYLANAAYIDQYGMKLRSEDVTQEGAVLCLDVDLVNKASRKDCRLITEITTLDGVPVTQDQCLVTLFPMETEHVHRRVFLDHPKLWSPSNPHLYQVHCELMEGDCLLDEQVETCGIRSLAVDPARGFRLNGEPLNLRGACIHHDHGLIGANTFQAAEDRRILKLKEAGFNTIRSAHNLVAAETLSACDRLGTRAYTSWLASEAKRKVYSVSYRLAPEHKAPCAIEDCQAVYEWIIKEHAGHRVALVGDSAGGNMVLALALKLKDEGIRLPYLVAAFSPVTCFAESYQSRIDNNDTDPIISGKDFQDMAAAYAGEDADLRNPYLSPVYGDYKGFPHLIVFADRGEVLFDDSCHLVEAAEAAGVQVDHVWTEGLFHAYPSFGGKMIPEARDAMAQVVAAL